MNLDPNLVKEFTPTGKLRASLNLGNPVLAHSRTAAERPAGVSIDMARQFASYLGVDVQLIEFETAGKSVDALTREQADIGFMAIDPLRATGIHFTPPYVQIEGCYLVAHGSPIRSNEEVDRGGIQVVVGNASAYDLYLSRTLQHASLVKVPTSEAVVDAMLEGKLPVAAGVRQQMEADATRIGGLRLLPERFMVINQAMAMPRERSAAAHALLDDFVQVLKASGFVGQALARHGIAGAKVAPA